MNVEVVNLSFPKTRLVGGQGLTVARPLLNSSSRDAIVYGHGLFTVAAEDFNIAFANLLDVERMCRDRYFESVDGRLS